MLEANSLFVQDEDGNDKRMEILFTFADSEDKRQYVVFQDPNENENEVYASVYDDKGNLFPIENDEEWEMIEEVIGAFQEDKNAVQE